MLCDTVYRFEHIPQKVDSKYLEIVLNCPQVTTVINSLKTGINESGVSLTHHKIENLEIPLPGLDEQERIVAEVERRLSVAEAVETSLNQQLIRATRLRQSILAKPFQ